MGSELDMELVIANLLALPLWSNNTFVVVGSIYALIGIWDAFSWHSGTTLSLYLPYRAESGYLSTLLGVLLRTLLWPVFNMYWFGLMLHNNVVFALLATPDEWHQLFRGEINFLPERMKGK